MHCRLSLGLALLDTSVPSLHKVWKAQRHAAQKALCLGLVVSRWCMTSQLFLLGGREVKDTWPPCA